MNYSAIKYNDIANGTGVRTVLFVSGCTHHCEDCFQPQTWDFGYGQPFTDKVTEEIIHSLAPDYTEGLTLLGGEPFEPENQKVLVTLLREFRKKWPLGNAKNIWAYTGYTLESDLQAEDGKARCEVTEEILSYIDVLVDGEFEKDKKNLMLNFRGSSNQRIIDMRKTLETKKTVLHSLNN